MIDAVFIDFYGTLVYEDGDVIRKVSQEIFDTGTVNDKSEIGAYWWREFQTAFLSSYGDNFQTQRELEYQSLVKTIEYFKSSADAVKLSNMMFEHWVKPPVFEESKRFLETSPVPVYIVSNIDRNDILQAVSYHGLEPAGIFTSEDAKSYKPRKELFEYALNATGLKADQVIHIGDSLSSDVKGAASVGISAIWINRGNKEIPQGVVSVENLMEILNVDFMRK